MRGAHGARPTPAGDSNLLCDSTAQTKHSLCGVAFARSVDAVPQDCGSHGAGTGPWGHSYAEWGIAALRPGSLDALQTRLGSGAQDAADDPRFSRAAGAALEIRSPNIQTQAETAREVALPWVVVLVVPPRYVRAHLGVLLTLISDQ